MTGGGGGSNSDIGNEQGDALDVYTSRVYMWPGRRKTIGR